MPEKLKRCVAHVKAQGKSEDSAWAICVNSTGLKPHKKSMEKAWEEFQKISRSITLRNEAGEPYGTEKHYSADEEEPLSPEDELGADYDYEYKRTRQELNDEYYPKPKKKKPMNDMMKAWEEFKKARKYCPKCGNFYNAQQFKTCPFCAHSSVDEIRAVEDLKNYPSNEQEENWREANDYQK